ncbi:unnamed protein product [Ectocarpus sp. 4 AP-2014]
MLSSSRNNDWYERIRYKGALLPDGLPATEHELRVHWAARPRLKTKKKSGISLAQLLVGFSHGCGTSMAHCVRRISSRPSVQHRTAAFFFRWSPFGYCCRCRGLRVTGIVSRGLDGWRCQTIGLLLVGLGEGS